MVQEKIVSALVFGVLFVALAMSVSVAEAAPSLFHTQNACERAVLTTGYEIYTPKYFGNHKKNPVDGVKSVVAPLEHVACVLMDTTSGRKWVVQVVGTELRFRIKDDGSLHQPYARHDCGNKVYGISFPQAEPAPAREDRGVRVAAASPQPAVVAAREPSRDVCAELGLLGENFINKTDDRGRMYCEEQVPWYKNGLVQYPVNTIVGGTVGYLKAGTGGALVGAGSGALGTYLGREIAGEGNEEWGWVGLPVGILGGSLMKGKSGSSSSSSGGTSGGGPSGGGGGISGGGPSGGGSGI